MLEPVKLSLATFQPNKCYAPYLNSPRSLEACRLNGVNPVELVEIPYNEFQKDFPNNADATKRRFERINGARVRLYENVMRDWKRLCDSGWGEKKKPLRPDSGKRETIVVVSPSAHCTLLEQQADKFRKIEQDNWAALQRNLKLELMRADEEVKHKEIVEKHAQIEEANNDMADKRKAERDELYRQQLLQQQQDYLEEQREIKKAQQEFQRAAIQRSAEEAENKRKEKMFREQKEQERVGSQRYTQQIRDSIVASLDNKVENRKKTCEVRAKSEENRIKEYFDQKHKERDAKRNEVDNKIKHTQAEKDRLANEQREAVLAKIRENEKHREHIAKIREEQKLQMETVNDNACFEKTQKIKEVKDTSEKEKCERTWQQLKHKEDLAKQELEKVRESQDRRRTIKAIRQEAHEIALLRAQKVEEYRREKLLQQLRDKEERTNAIKKGFETLDQMRNSMKDIMTRTNLGLKVEMHRLRHKDTFEPGLVIEKAIEVSDKVLFPSLERKFGIKDPNEVDPVQKLFRNTGDDGFSFNVGNDSNAFMTTNEPDNEILYEGDRTANMKSTQDKKKAMAKSKSMSDAAPLPIHQLTHNNLKTALLESMKKVDDLNNKDPLGRTISPSRSKSPTSTSHRGGGTRKDGQDDDGYPTPILKLDEEGSAYSSKHSKSQSRSVKSAPNSHSPTTHSNNHSANHGDALSRSDGFKQSHSRARKPPERDDDPNLPMYPFAAGAEFNDEQKPVSPPKSTDPKKFDPKKYLKNKAEIRTDVNEKAKFLEPPTGKFRREFSNDHPLAAGGTGKYKKELNKGLKPTGLDVAAPKTKATDVADTLALAEKVEKLTYDATSSVVDGDKSLENLEKELKEKLQSLVEEETSAEEERVETLTVLKDPAERYRLEKIFAEERMRASERIMKATREHDELIKKAMLRTVNLGSAIQ